jgi:hypothetical protein
MKTGTRTLLSMAIALLVGSDWARAESTALTYQGSLQNGGSAANGNYDMTFGMYASSSGGSSVGGVLTNSNLSVTNGLFSAALDFGNVFDGTPYWLEIGVRPHGGTNNFVILSPRQAFTPIPYALHALSATTASMTTGAIADNQLSGNVARLNGSANFTGTLTANGFVGNGAGLTNVSAASTSDPGAVRKANNGSDFANNVATANNIGVQVVNGTQDWFTNINNATPAFAGQLAVAQNGFSYPYLFNGMSTTKGDWLGSFRFLGICQFGDRTRMHTNFSQAQYIFFINGATNQPTETAGNNVIVLENEHTNFYSAISFQFAQQNNYLPGHEAGSIGVGNCGTQPPFSNALYLHAAGVPINFTMAGRPSGSYPPGLLAYFDYPTGDFHYIDRNGNQAFNIRASDGQVSVNGTVTANAFTGNGAGLTNLNASGFVDTGVVRKTNNGSDFSSLPTARKNLGIFDLGNSGPEFAWTNQTAAYPGQLGTVQNGGAVALYQARSTTPGDWWADFMFNGQVQIGTEFWGTNYDPAVPGLLVWANGFAGAIGTNGSAVGGEMAEVIAQPDPRAAGYLCFASPSGWDANIGRPIMSGFADFQIGMGGYLYGTNTLNGLAIGNDAIMAAINPGHDLHFTTTVGKGSFGARDFLAYDNASSIWYIPMGTPGNGAFKNAGFKAMAIFEEMSGNVTMTNGQVRLGVHNTAEAPLYIDSSGNVYLRNVTIGSTNTVPAPGVALDLNSTNQALLLPRLTKAQRNAISGQVAGMAVYQSDNSPGLRVYNGTHWVKYAETNDD